MKRVLITDHLPPPPDIERRVLDGLATVTCLEAKTADELRGRLGDADGVLLYHDLALDEDLIAEMERCRAIVRCGVGFDNVDLRVAGERGVWVCNIPDYGVDEVADHAIGLMLACCRGMVRADAKLRENLSPWNADVARPLRRLAGTTMGIVGCGRIGAAAVARAKAMRMRVVVCDPYLRPGMDKALGVELVDLDTLLARADVVSLHTPLTEETKSLIGERELSLMKPTAFLINTARGEVLDTDALAVALESGVIAGAGVDVLPVEPPAADSALIRLWRESAGGGRVNLVITPHIAYYSESALEEIRIKGAEELARVFRGEPPKNPVNREWLKES
ncbi:MAG: C-terminal binding protein [Pseudanabaenales cyanobacterium]|nr:C-terminal binding protein [Pseudanabaenales cyanobacterium]